MVLDPHGSYKVQLGATLPNGLPVGLFSGGAARWLEVQAAGEAPQTRVLLVSVPYAFEAANAATLGGLPASAFALAGARTVGSISGVGPDTASTVTTTGGTNLYLPKFSGATTIVDSEIYDTGTSVGIGDVPNASAKLDVNGPMIMRGNMTVSRTGNATASKGYPSYGFDFFSNAYNSSTKAGDNPYFQLQSEPTGNDTASPSATFNLLFANDGSAPAETGFSINPDGTINFANGQTFPGSGSGTITGVTAGTALTGGGSTGTVTLNVDTTKVPLLTASNTFTGNQTVTGRESVSGSITGGANLILPNTASSTVGVVQLGTTPFLSNYGPANSGNVFVGGAGNFTTSGTLNTAVGSQALTNNTTGQFLTALGVAALNSNTTGMFNTAAGVGALGLNTTGQNNTAVGQSALNYNTSGSGNTAVGSAAIQQNTTGQSLTALGYGALYASTTATNNTAIGVNALAKNTTGSFNVGLGEGALYNTTTGGSNTAIGYGAGPSSATLGFTNAIGGGAIVSQTNSLVLGSTYLGVPGKYFNNVGVGTDTPRSVLDLVASEPSGLGPVLTLTNSGGGSAATTAIDFNTYAPSTTGTYNPAARIQAYSDNDSANISFLSNKTGATNQGLQYNMTVYDNGDVNVTGTLSAAVKQFKIDHPQDPTNKFLVHASVESSEMMNIYSGNVVTDEAGLATVKLPGWFEAENADFRYQLTVIGTFAQAIVKDKVANGEFRIMTNAADVEVSWQITAVRQDAYAKAHPLVVEQEKSAAERGFYAHPEVYGESLDRQIGSSHAHDQPATAVNLHLPQPTPTAIPPHAQGVQRQSVAKTRSK